MSNNADSLHQNQEQIEGRGQSAVAFDLLKETSQIIIDTVKLAIAELKVTPRMFALMAFSTLLLSGFLMCTWLGLSTLASYGAFVLSNSILLALTVFLLLQCISAALAYVAFKYFSHRLLLPNTFKQIAVIKEIFYEIASNNHSANENSYP